MDQENGCIGYKMLQVCRQIAYLSNKSQTCVFVCVRMRVDAIINAKITLNYTGVCNYFISLIKFYLVRRMDRQTKQAFYSIKLKIKCLMREILLKSGKQFERDSTIIVQMGFGRFIACFEVKKWETIICLSILLFSYKITKKAVRTLICFDIIVVDSLPIKTV